jgi:hypothetical protein
MADQQSATDTVPARADLLDYRIENDVLVPHTIASYVSGHKQAIAHVTSLEFNKEISPTEFDASEEQ